MNTTHIRYLRFPRLIASLIGVITVASSAVGACNPILQDDDIYQINIPTTDGKVAWSAIADVITKELGAEVPALGELTGGGELDVNARGTWIILFSVNKFLNPAIDVSVDRAEEAITIRIDRSEIDAARKKWGAKLRNRNNEKELARGRELGLHPFLKDTNLDTADQIVVLVHGFNSNTSKFSMLASQLEELDEADGIAYAIARFDYPTRDGVQPAADLLEQELTAIAKANPDCEISIVTHSMGGVITRAIVEKEGFDVPQVKRIIMVAPPNHGSHLAVLPTGAQQLDFLLANIDRPRIRRSLRAMAAEANLALGDLRPESEFLSELNKRERNPAIKYSIILGQTGVMTASQSEIVEQAVIRMQATDQKILAQGGEELSAIFDLLSNELVTGHGDGVVSLESGRLAGVSDRIVLDFQHNDLQDGNSKTQAAIIEAIAFRLKAAHDPEFLVPLATLADGLKDPDYRWDGPASNENRIAILHAARALAYRGEDAAETLFDAIDDSEIEITSLTDAVSEIGIPVRRFRKQINKRDSSGLREWWKSNRESSRAERDTHRNEIGLPPSVIR